MFRSCCVVVLCTTPVYCWTGTLFRSVLQMDHFLSELTETQERNNLLRTGRFTDHRSRLQITLWEHHDSESSLRRTHVFFGRPAPVWFLVCGSQWQITTGNEREKLNSNKLACSIQHKEGYFCDLFASFDSCYNAEVIWQAGGKMGLHCGSFPSRTEPLIQLSKLPVDNGIWYWALNQFHSASIRHWGPRLHLLGGQSGHVGPRTSCAVRSAIWSCNLWPCLRKRNARD